MRPRLAAFALTRLVHPALLAVLLSACKSEPARLDPPPPRQSALEREPSRSFAAPRGSAAVALEKTLQATKLSPPPRRTHAPRLAFGKGVLGQLTEDALRVFDSTDFRQLAVEPLDSPRALVALADGSLLAIGERAMLRWERDKKRASTLPRPVLLPGAQLYPDAQQASRLWVFDAEGRSGAVTLDSYDLKASAAPFLLPEQSIELTSGRGGVFGVTREGTWLYVTAHHAERLGASGLRLSGLNLNEPALPTWILPARRLDQSLWLDEQGHLTRALVSPDYQRLASVQLPGTAFDVDVGDEGRLLAVVMVTGAGPRFELMLLNQALAQIARVVLPSDGPTGGDDWVKVVTENQAVVAAPREPRVAVGGRARVTIFNGRGERLFSIPSK